MRLVHRLLALAMLAVWMPATLHCSLEASGLDKIFHCDEQAHNAERDSCGIVESAGFKPATNTATLPPLQLCVCLLSLPEAPADLSLPPPASGLAERRTAPPEVARTWHFLVRAAPAPRAPSFAS